MKARSLIQIPALATVLLTMPVGVMTRRSAGRVGPDGLLDQVVIEPLPWTGNMAQPHDKTNRGKYLFEIVDPANGDIAWSRSFSSIYGEWETTGESREINRSFHESVRFPAQDAIFELVIKKRCPAGLTFKDGTCKAR